MRCMREAQKVEGTIDSINVNMYELYSYDTNFKALETARGLNCLAYGYQLSDQLKTLELYEKRNISFMRITMTGIQKVLF